MNSNNNISWMMFYRGEHYIKATVNDCTTENEYKITLFVQPSETAGIRLTIRNLENELDSYTSDINAEMFEEIKANQNLLLNYPDLTEQIKVLLDQNLIYENRVILRIYEAEDSKLELGFFAMSDLKELTLLVLPCEFTSTNDIILYLKDKVDHEAIQKQMFLEKYEVVNSELQNLSLKYRHLFSNFNNAIHKMAEFEHHNTMLIDENSQLKLYVAQLEAEQNEYVKSLGASTNTINNMEKYVTELKTDLNCLQVGVNYYSNSSNALKSTLRELESNTVSKEKYLKLRNMFSNAIVDLAKCQITLSKLASLHKGQKDENVQLQQEISGLTNVISNMETCLKADPVNTEDVAEIRDLIEQLELKNSGLQSNPNPDSDQNKPQK